MSVGVVVDTSAVLALILNEDGARHVEGWIGRAAISGVNLQELVKSLILRGLERGVIEEIVDELRLEVYAHDRTAAFDAATLVTATRAHGSGLGDRSCMALAIRLGVPVLTADRSWAVLDVAGLDVQLIR